MVTCLSRGLPGAHTCELRVCLRGPASMSKVEEQLRTIPDGNFGPTYARALMCTYTSKRVFTHIKSLQTHKHYRHIQNVEKNVQIY